MRSGQILGGALVFLGVVGLLCGGAWLIGNLAAPERGLGAGGAIVGGVLIAVVSLPMLAVGGFLLVRGNREAAQARREQETGEKQRRLLDAVKTRGQIP